MSLIPDIDLLEALKATGELATVAGIPVYGSYADDSAEDLGIAGTRPTLTCRTVDVTSVVDGTAVVARSKSYKVRGRPQADRSGRTKLTLELQ